MKESCGNCGHQRGGKCYRAETVPMLDEEPMEVDLDDWCPHHPEEIKRLRGKAFRVANMPSNSGGPCQFNEGKLIELIKRLKGNTVAGHEG